MFLGDLRLALPFPLGDLAVAILGDRRALPRGEVLGVVFRLVPRRRRLLPSFLGVFRMLKAIDWRRSGCLPVAWGSPFLLPRLRSSFRSLGVWGRGKQLVGFLESGVSGPW